MRPTRPRAPRSPHHHHDDRLEHHHGHAITAARARPAATTSKPRGAHVGTAPPVPPSPFVDAVNAPITLPPNCKGEPIAHLSHSSVARWFACPDDWRRHHILRQRGPKAGVMFLGSRVDDAITEFYRRQIAGSTLTLPELVDVFRDTWRPKLKADGDRIAWEHGLTPTIAERMGRTAVTLTYERLVPRLGTPVAAQRKFEIRLAPTAAMDDRRLRRPGHPPHEGGVPRRGRRELRGPRRRRGRADRRDGLHGRAGGPAPAREDRTHDVRARRRRSRSISA